MLIDYKGPTVAIILDANESQSQYIHITLADGYSYEQIKVLIMQNVTEILPYCDVAVNTSVIYPPIRSKSPCTLDIRISDITKRSVCAISIEKFGQLPDINYFNGKIPPILVTGDDGKEYNVIPSDQFK